MKCEVTYIAIAQSSDSEVMEIDTVNVGLMRQAEAMQAMVIL